MGLYLAIQPTRQSRLFFIFIEIWKSIDVCQWKYEVSSYWNIRHKKNMKNLTQNLAFWYVHQTLSNNWYPKRFRLHILIAQVFIPNPDNKPFVNHKNWIKHDNRIENLEWVDGRENNLHAFKELWNTTTSKKKPIIQYDKEMTFIAEFESVSSAGRILWIQHQQISNNLVWKQPHCHGFIFKYKTN